jgi:hypothetical protein
LHLSGIDLVLWLAGFLANLVLLAVLIGKRRFIAFPVFTSWIALSVVRTSTLFFAYRMGHAPYYYAYWAFAFVDMGVQLLIFYEAAVHIFRPGPEWPRDVRSAFLWITAVALVVGIALTWLGAPAADNYLSRITIRGNFLSSVLMGELFIAMIGMSFKLGLPWQTHVAKIVQGLGAYSLIGIASSCLQTYFGFTRGGEVYTAITHARIGAYIICAGFWIVTLYMEAPEPKALPEEMHRQLVLVQQRASFVLGRLSGSGRA